MFSIFLDSRETTFAGTLQTFCVVWNFVLTPSQTAPYCWTVLFQTLTAVFDLATRWQSWAKNCHMISQVCWETELWFLANGSCWPSLLSLDPFKGTLAFLYKRTHSRENLQLQLKYKEYFMTHPREYSRNFLFCVFPNIPGCVNLPWLFVSLWWCDYGILHTLNSHWS